ncbi:hypothetical protein FRB94_002669 [Tulasnella sp. JGI-2019a]|nr:hypothetical protein FRB93_002101 [Tulasnella sp. JGI-2019a]KAG9004078.1 hypothetical protein FRB94_002669 [Tulasnella sp. JGI-2019a]
MRSSPSLFAASSRVQNPYVQPIQPPDILPSNMASAAANRKALLDNIKPNIQNRPRGLSQTFRATEEELLATAKMVQGTVPNLLVESFYIVWASSTGSHGHFLAPPIRGGEDPWDFTHPIALLEEQLPDLDREETLRLGDKVKTALGVETVSCGIRCIGFQYQTFDAMLSGALTESFNEPKFIRSAAPSPPPESERELGDGRRTGNGDGNLSDLQGSERSADREWNTGVIVSGNTAIETSSVTIDERNRDAVPEPYTLPRATVVKYQSTVPSITASGPLPAAENRDKTRYRILSDVPFPVEYVDYRERTFTSHSSGRILELLPFYYIPAPSQWLNWTCDHRTTGWCISPPRISLKADIERQRSMDGWNTPDAWEKDRDVEIIESLGDGVHLYVGTFGVMQEPLPKMELLEFEGISNETAFAVKDRIMLGHEQEPHVYERIWSDLQAGKTLLPCTGFRYVGYNGALLNRLQGLALELPGTRVKGGENSRLDQLSTGSSPILVSNDGHVDVVNTTQHQSIESSRLLEQYNAALSALQPCRTAIGTQNSAKLINNLRDCTQDVFEYMMEENKILLSQIQKLKAQLKNSEMGGSS